MIRDILAAILHVYPYGWILPTVDGGFVHIPIVPEGDL